MAICVPQYPTLDNSKRLRQEVINRYQNHTEGVVKSMSRWRKELKLENDQRYTMTGS